MKENRENLENRTEKLLDFIVGLSREMMESGANLERVKLTIRRICKVYRVRVRSVFFAGDVLSVEITAPEGEHYQRQEAVSGASINLMRLKKLNNLVHRVMGEQPDIGQLQDLLFEAMMVKPYSAINSILAYVLAMVSLCRIFGGTVGELFVVAVNTVILYFIINLFTREKLNRIITNVVSMFICGVIAILASRIGLAKNISAVIITNAFYLIPGIPMVNAIRNIFCGNEMNGIIEMIKVFLEVATIVAGLYFAFLLLGTDVSIFI